MATVLELAEAAALKLGIDQPSELIGSSTRENQELAEAFEDARADILQAHEWQKLRTIQTITGDGSTLAYSLPSDFDRLLDDPNLYTSEFEVALSFVPDADDWLRYEVQSYDFVINVWTVYGDMVHTKPALGSAITGKHWYISNQTILDTDGTTKKEEWAADTDTFRLDDTLLKLGAIYKYRQNKGQPYAEEMADYEKRKTQMIKNDGGKKAFRSKPSIGRGAVQSYPQSVSNA